MHLPPPVARVTRPLLPPAGVLALAGAGLLTGYALSRLAGVFGDFSPVALLALVALPAAALAVLADPRWGVVAVFALFPLGLVEIPGTPVELAQVVIAAVAALVLLRQLAGADRLLLPAPLWWLVALLAWSLVALPSSLDRSLAVRQVAALAGEAVFVAVVVLVCRRHGDVRRLMAALVVVAAAVALTTPAASTRVRSGFGGAVVKGRARGIFTEPNQLGTFCMGAGLVALALALGSNSRRSRLAAGAAGAVIFVGLLLSLSRGSWIGFSCGMVVLLLTLKEARRAVLSVGLPLLLLAALAGNFTATAPQVEVVGERLQSLVGEKNPYDDRPQIWAEAQREMIADPLTGHGPGNFEVASQRATSESRTAFALHAHNLLLTWGAEAGLPAALIILGFAAHLGLLTSQARRRARAAGRVHDAALLAGLAAAMAAVMGQGLLDYTLRNSVVFTAVMGVLGGLLAMVNIERAEPRPAAA